MTNTRIITGLLAIIACGCSPKQDAPKQDLSSIFDEGVQCGYNACLHEEQLALTGHPRPPAESQSELVHIINSNIAIYLPKSWNKYHHGETP